MFQGAERSNLISSEAFAGEAGTTTGYYYFKKLQRFLEDYVALKKTQEGRDFVLALEMWKDQEIYFCSPVSFDMRRSAASPLEYQYSINLRGWKRVNTTSEDTTISVHQPVARSPNKLFQVLNALNTSRLVLQKAKTTLSGVRGDIKFVLFEPLRQTTLFVKDALGVAIDATDLPGNIVRDFKQSILEARGQVASVKSLYSNQTSIGDKIDGLMVDLGLSSGKFETLNAGYVPQIGTLRQAQDAAPANTVLDNPEDNFEFFKDVKPGNLNLPPHTQKQINDEKQKTRNLKREDFERFRDGIVSVLVDFEAAVGEGNTTYDSTYSTPVRAKKRDSTDSDFDVIFNLNSAIMEFNRLAASSTINLNQVDSIDYIAGLASKSGIAFNTPKSKFLVPFPYGYTLEQLSNQYLGTPDRWHEIAALNGLRAPYVDEVGFTLPLLTNGFKNTVTVSDITHLYVNQSVWISSQTVQRTSRRVTKIESLSPTMHRVTVSGDSDLDTYIVSYTPTIQGFLPNTVNSLMSIYIPSDTDADEEDYRHKSIAGINQFDPLIRAGGIDLLLTQNNDLVVTPDGDSRLAVGLNNIVQKVRLAVETQRGSVLRHPDYGFPVRPGDSTADSTAQSILDDCKTLFVGDPTFDGVESAYVLKDGPSLTVSLSVRIAGTNQTIPVTIDIPNK
jgi:hypothetical protein